MSFSIIVSALTIFTIVLPPSITTEPLVNNNMVGKPPFLRNALGLRNNAGNISGVYEQVKSPSFSTCFIAEVKLFYSRGEVKRFDL